MWVVHGMVRGEGNAGPDVTIPTVHRLHSPGCKINNLEMTFNANGIERYIVVVHIFLVYQGTNEK